MPIYPIQYPRIPYVSQDLGQLLMLRGQHEADAIRQQGDIQARMWTDLGKNIASGVEGYAKEKAAEPEREMQRLTLESARQKFEAQKLVDALPVMATPEGRQAQLAALDGPARAVAEQHYQAADEAAARLEQIKAQTRSANLTADKAQQAIDAGALDVFGALAAGVKAHSYAPGAFYAAVADAHGKGLVDLQQAGQMVAHGLQNPDWIKSTTDELIARSPEQQQLEEKRLQEKRLAEQAAAEAADKKADNDRADAAATRADKALQEQIRHNKAMETRPVAGAQAGQAFTDDGVEYAATQYRLTGKMPSLGNGAGDVKAKIISQAAAQAKALGQTPVTSIQKQAAYAGDAKALAKMQGMSASAEAFETKASQQIPIVKELSAKVGRLQFPILNKAIVAGKADILGDKNAQLLFNALTTFSSEYAKIMEGSTGSSAGSSDASRAAAQRLVSAYLNKGTLNDTLDLMQREMDLTLQGYDATIAHINERMGGSAAPASTAGASGRQAPITKPIPGIPGAEATSTDGGNTWVRSK